MIVCYKSNEYYRISKYCCFPLFSLSYKMFGLPNRESYTKENNRVYTTFPEPTGKVEMTGLLSFEAISSSSKNPYKIVRS